MTRFDYDQTDIHRVYSESRRLPSATLGLWLHAIARRVPPAEVETVADVGCGTGRFMAGLAERLHATVIGVDPSAKMLSVARDDVTHPGCHLVRAEAEALPLRDRVADMVFLSVVYHHLRDRSAALGESRRVLALRKYLVIRMAVRERLDSYLWLRFFPSARPIEFGRTPSRAELLTTVTQAGFALVAHDTVHHPFAADLGEYAEKIALRGLSSLKAIPDEEFEEGIARLRERCCENETDQPVYEEMDLFVFQRH